MKIVEIAGKEVILTPSNWIMLDGVYTPEELRKIADEVEKNYKKIKNK